MKLVQDPILKRLQSTYCCQSQSSTERRHPWNKKLNVFDIAQTTLDTPIDLKVKRS